MQTLPPIILTHLQPFRSIFLTNTTYLKTALLLTGALMCRGARTVCSILRVLGLKGETAFSKYHHVLNRAKWEVLEGSRILLNQIDQNQDEPLKLVIDGHLERRKGDKISAKGHYRDAAQSSKNYTVISPGLKWISVMVLKKFSWCQRTLALPFLTILAPHEKCKHLKHKTLQKWTCQVVKQIRRWLPNRKIILTADNEFATAEIALSCKKQKIAFVSRLKHNARLFNFPIQNRLGRPRNKGARLPSIESVTNSLDINWEPTEVNWYGGVRKTVQLYSGTCLWHVMAYSSTPIPIRYVIIKNSKDNSKPVLLMSTDTELDPAEIIETYVERWNIEVTFQETREHLGVETQRQWSDKAIARSTPILFALYSLVILMGDSLIGERKIDIEQTAWYAKSRVKFSDILRGIRKEILEKLYFCKGWVSDETDEKSPSDIAEVVKNLFLNAA